MKQQNNEKIKDIASDILSSQDLPEDKFGSVIMIIMMVAILVNVIRVIQECNKDKDENESVEKYKSTIIDLSNRRGWFTKMRLKKIIRRELSKEDYKDYGNTLVEAILNKGASITDEEVSVLLEAKNNV